ncbi:MRPP3 ribonuclease, partial [Acromyrmex heyeri]
MTLFYKLCQPLRSHFYKFNINMYVLSKQSYSSRKIVDLKTLITENDIYEEMKSDLSTIEWKSIREKILQKNTEITSSIVDSIIIDMCVNYFHVNNAIAYFKFLKENNYSLNTGVIGKYLKLYVLKQNSLTDADKIEIVETYNYLRQKYQHLDSVTAKECIISLCLTDEWEKTQDIIEMVKITSSPGTTIYSALASAAFRNGKPDIAWKALTDIVLRKLIPNKYVYLSHLQYCQLEDAKFFNNRIEEMFHFWIKHSMIPYDKIIRTYANTAIKYGWSTDRITISKKTGNCKHCGYFLSKITFSEDEFQELAKFVMDRVIIGSDIYNKTNPKELLKFKEFIENTKPFDVYFIKFSATGIRIQDPFTYLPIVQKNDNCWHVPCVTEDLNRETLKEFYDFSDKWYCLKYNEKKMY